MAFPERGLQRERTALAWDRTGVAFMVVGALLLRVGGAPFPHLRHVPAAFALLLGAGLSAGAARGWGRGGDPPRARPVLLRVVGLSAVLVSLAALTAVALAPR